MILDLLKSFSAEIFTVPQHDNDDGTPNPAYGQQSYRWRLKMATITTLLVGAQAFMLATAYGFLGEGFASAGDVKSIQATALEARLDKYTTALCMNQGDSGLLEIIRDLQAQYIRIRGTRYQSPNCDVLVKAK